MKAEELMIGDWVQLKEDKSVFKVSSHWGIYNAAEFEPVPITREILAKYRFIKREHSGYPNHYTYVLPNDGAIFTIFSIGDTDFSFNINNEVRKINYVHELQHVLKLCGINKEIEL